MSDHYVTIQARVDQQFNALKKRYRRDFACKEGCHQCCTPDLSVSLVEAQKIQSTLQDHKGLRESALELEEDNPHQGRRCSFLTASGQCLIYQVRPLICRSHGAPVLVPLEGEREALDACELNFLQGMSHLRQGDWIGVETLNTQLSLINILIYKERSGERVTLSPSSILAADTTPMNNKNMGG